MTENFAQRVVRFGTSYGLAHGFPSSFGIQSRAGSMRLISEVESHPGAGWGALRQEIQAIYAANIGDPV
jgi:hypothetical protein